MNNKLICILAILSVGFLFLLCHTKTVQIETDTSELSPYWWQVHEPYLSLLDQCRNGTVPDNYACVYKLAHSTLKEADAIAEKLIQASPSVNTKYIPEFYEVLPGKVQVTQKVKDAYFDAFCDLDSMLMYGGTGSTTEREACRYFYAEKYLDLLKSLMQR